MANFINDLVKAEIKDMLSEIVDEAQEKVDDLFGDQGENNNRRATLSVKINLSAKSDTVVEVKTPCSLVEVPAVPAKKVSFNRVRNIDITQGRIEFPDDEEGDEE